MAAAAIGLILAAAGTGSAISSSSKATAARKEAAQATANIARLENVRARRKQVREAQIATGSVASRGATSSGGGGFGTLASSGAQGQAVGVASQLESNLRFISQADRLNAVASTQNVRASQHETNANTASAVASLGFNVAQTFG